MYVVLPVAVEAGGKQRVYAGARVVIDHPNVGLLPHELLAQHGIAVMAWDYKDPMARFVKVHDYDLNTAVDALKAYRPNRNHLLPHSARVFKPSENFSAIVRTGRGGDDTIIVTYQGPSLSTARVKAKIAADQWKRPVDVIDEHWRKIATYGPGSGA